MFNQSINYMKSKSFLAKAFLMLLAVLFSLTGARAQETLTVYEGTATNNIVPAYIFYFDDFTRSQFVIPAGDLEAMAGGGTISALKFYTISDNVPYTTVSEVDVYLMEVDYTTMTALEPKDNGIIVYHGTLDVVAEGDGGSLTIEFDTPYTYGGGNLLVGIENTTDAGYKNIKFLGTEAEGAACAGSNGTSLDDVAGSVRNFIPMTTFTYTPGGGVVYPKPTDLTVSDLGTNSVTISWTEPEGKVDGYAYQYKKAKDEEWSTEATVVDPTVALTDLTSGTPYNFRVKAIYGEDASSYASINFTTDCDVVSIPFEEEFTGDITCWTLTDCHSQTGLNGGVFQFHYSTTPPQYLISPEFNATTAIMVSFYYLIYSANYPETFQVGYSSTTRDVDAFTWKDEVTATNASEWLKYEAECPAGTKFVAIRYNSNDMYYLFVTNFSIEESNGLFTPTDLAVSEIGNKSAKLSWTENGEATAWQIALNGDEENLIAADSNPFTLEGLTPETAYTAKVRAVNGEKTSKWSNEVSFTTDIQFPAPTELATEPATTTATITWTGTADSYNLRYRVSTGGDELVTDFEDSSMGEWTTIDADGDGNTWVLGSAAGGIYIQEGGSLAGTGRDSSQDLIVSGSYSNVTGALTPDNYLVSPQITLGGSISFYACAQDASYAAEHFGVAVSTAGNTDAADFTTIQEWTMTNTGAPASSRRKAQGTWGLFTVDLSAYAGQEGYVAIRHFNCTDQFLLNVDDITIVEPAEGEEQPWTTIANATSPYTIEGLDPETKYDVQVQAVYADGESTWAATHFTTLSENSAPSNIAADLVADGATLTWEGQGDSYNVRYRVAGDDGEIFADDFENGLGNWTIYTEGEAISGYDGWVMMSNGTYVAASFSWYGGTAYAADNWLITPAVELTGTLTFDVMVDASYPDSYEVLLSTTGDAIEDFTTELQAMAGGTTGTVTIDLSAYAGQTGYIAIHHVSTDCNYLCIDNFGIYSEPTPAGEWQTIATNDLTATISGLETNSLYEYQIQSVKGESESEWSEIDEFALVTLDCAGENSDLINKFNGKYAHVTLANRTFYQDGTWNTIYLPFDMSAEELEASPLGGADIRTLSNSTMEGNTVTLNFIPDAVNAWGQYYGGVAYIAKWTSGSGIENPAFANVTITTDEYYTGDDEGDVMVQFYGTYDFYQFVDDNTSLLFIGADNKLNYPLAGATIGATRGYFTLEGVTAGEESGVKFFTNLGDEDPTGIANINAEEGGDWYDISGRKLAGKPSMKGIYVNGGRKVTVK